MFRSFAVMLVGVNGSQSSVERRTDMNGDGQVQGYFRCPVPGEQSAATLVVGRSRLSGELLEKSIDGFTLLLPGQVAKKLRLGVPLVLESDAEWAEVHVQWFFHVPGNRMQLGLRRLRDLTPEPQMKQTWWRLGYGKARTLVGPDLLVGLLAVAFVCAISLPGIGDQLGTAPRVREAIHTVFQMAGEAWRRL